VSARERKRYEAVWASNRGLFLTGSTSSPSSSSSSSAAGDAAAEDINHYNPHDLVVNIVVRDIWSRSRLPPDELAEVWDLVDRKHIGALDRQEFVVGMWLIDQRLRGRKIPARVGASVWESARAGGGMSGITVPAPHSSVSGGHHHGGGREIIRKKIGIHHHHRVKRDY